MKKFLASIFTSKTFPEKSEAIDFDTLSNENIRDYEFLGNMYHDDYFPNFLVDKGKNILLNLCLKIEAEEPKDKNEVYALTHIASERFNLLAIELEENNSEIETDARVEILEDIDFIFSAYGFDDLDAHEAVTPCDW